MTDPLITLTTDFGDASPYVAAMKGVILGLNPSARLIDLSHRIPPQDVRHAAFFLASAVPYFPPRTLHVVVVDPGVGSERALLFIEVAGQRLLAPDNGCWTMLAQPTTVIRLAEPRFWRTEVSHTFHGRDILAPVAGHLSLGIDARQLGPEANEWVRLEIPKPRAVRGPLSGEVLFVDSFGNLITNLNPAELRTPPTRLKVGGRSHRFQWVDSYAQARPGSLVMLTSSNGLLEIAVAQGNAGRKLRARVGTRVVIS